MIRVFLAGARFQALLLRRSPAELMSLLTAPLFTLAFTAIVVHAGRPQLTPYAVLGPAVIAVWSMALNVSGDLIDSERYNGTFEATLATPASLQVLAVGRIATVTLVSLLSLLESWIVVRIAFGITLHLEHPGLFAIAIVLTAAAMVGTATALSPLFVLARSARTFQNSLSYPIYLLSGAMVPTSLLPAWLQPASKAVFLSWSASLMRDSLNPAPPPDVLFRLAVITGLGALGYGAGIWLMHSVLRHARFQGTVGYA